MLGEMKAIKAALCNSGISISDGHRAVVPSPVCSDGSMMVVELGKSGLPCRISFRPAQDFRPSRLDSGANGVSFPAVGIPPLYPDAKPLKLKRGEFPDGPTINYSLLQKIAETTINKKIKAKIRKSLVFARETLKPILEAIGGRQVEDLRGIMTVLNLIPVVDDDYINSFVGALLSTLHAEIQNGAYSQSELCNLECLLFGSTDIVWKSIIGKNGKERQVDVKAISTYLYLEADGYLSCPATSQRSAAALSGILKKYAPGKKLMDIDAISVGGAGFVKTFPLVALPFKGKPVKVSVFSINAASPCQHLYGKHSGEVFPISEAEADEMVAATEWLFHSSRQNRTWTRLPSANGGKGLLAVYLQRAPDCSALFAEILGGPADSVIASGSFEKASESVLKMINDMEEPTDTRLSDPQAVAVFYIEQASRGEVRVLRSEHYSIEQLKLALARWRAGCCVESAWIGEKSTWVEPIYPAQLVTILNQLWVRNAELCEKKGRICSPGDVMTLFLGGEREASRLAKRMIKHLPETVRKLIVPTVGGWHTGKLCLHGAAVVQTLKAINLLLHLANGGVSMTTAYYIGRWAALADSLHKKFCKEVSGSSPSQLIGSSFVVQILRNPAQGFFLLNQRMMPYVAWGKTRRAWQISKISEAAEEITKHGLIDRFTSRESCEFFLGFGSKLRDEGCAPQEPSEQEVTIPTVQ